MPSALFCVSVSDLDKLVNVINVYWLSVLIVLNILFMKFVFFYTFIFKKNIINYCMASGYQTYACNLQSGQ